MGVGLGWKEMAPQFPYIDGEVWNDGITRTGNTVSYSFNFKLQVREQYGYWNYAWFVNMSFGGKSVNDKKIKNRVYSNQVIGGTPYWYSNMNGGNFTGTVTVDGKTTSLPFKVKFYDDAGNQGPEVTWNVPIPAASSMSVIRGSSSVLGDDSVTIRGSVDSAGLYSTITKWELGYGKNSYTEHTLTKDTSALSASWTLSGLESATYYKYRLRVSSSSGYSQDYTGTFTTEDSIIGYLVQDGKSPIPLLGYVVSPDGNIKKLKEIRRR